MCLRIILCEALNQYVSDTTALMSTVKDFTDNSDNWISTVRTKSEELSNTKEKYSEICDSVFTLRAESKQATLQKELESSLELTLVSLKQLEVFVEAVEKLAVSSLPVFEQVSVLSGADLETLKQVIFTAQIMCPALLSFKRDHEVFFSPRLQNIEVMTFQLDQYILRVKDICDVFKESLPTTDLKTMMDLTEDIPEHCILNMLSHINVLQEEIRMDEHFRTVMLFQDRHSVFMKEFSDRQELMLQFLTEVEKCAVELDNMNKGAKISSVVGSSVGAVGGVLSIIGLALTPVTLGASLVLTLTGVSIGVTSGVNGLVTAATELGVNHTQKTKANQAFEKFMENVTVVQMCLEKVIFTQQEVETNTLMGGLSVAGAAAVVGKGIDSLVDKAAKGGKMVATEGKVMSNVSQAASEIPDLGQAAVKAPLAMSRGGLIALNALFIGMDVIFIVKDSINLYKGSETLVSQFLRARADLWRSEIDSWKKIHDCLEKGCLDSEKKQDLLKKPFYEFI